MVLDDQNLCIQTSSSFIYGALPIRGDIYVVGDLDTGEWAPPPPRRPPPREADRVCLQEPTSTTSGSSGAARAAGTGPCPCCPPTCPSPPAPPSASPTAACSTFSSARERSGSESEGAAALRGVWVRVRGPLGGGFFCTRVLGCVS